MSDKKLPQAKGASKHPSAAHVTRLYRATFPYWNSGGYQHRTYKSDVKQGVTVLALINRPSETILAEVRRWLTPLYHVKETVSYFGSVFFELTAKAPDA